MEEPLFPFFSDGDERERQHCHDCGLPLPDQGDPEVIWVPVQSKSGDWQLAPACRRHWREAQTAGADSLSFLRAEPPDAFGEGGADVPPWGGRG